MLRTTRFTATALNITGCTSSSASDKAAIVLEERARATLNRLILEYNQNRAIYVNQGAYLVLTKSHVVSNSISDNGGAMYVEDYSTIRIQKSNFKGTLSQCQTIACLSLFELVYIDP